MEREVLKKKTDPSTYYELHKKKELGVGAYASVSLVTRKTDGKEYAMKLIKYKELRLTSKEMENMVTEVGLL
jgi:hypothetical protein